MSILFSSRNSSLILGLSKCVHLKIPHIKNISLMSVKYSQELPLENEKLTTSSKVIPFQDMIKSKQDEANRSIIVQVQSAQSFKELHTYCSKIGTVKNMIHYSTGVEPMQFIIVEFSKESDVKNIFTTSSYIDDAQIVPVQSHFLWFRASARKLPKLKSAKNFNLLLENGNDIPNDAYVCEKLRDAQNISEQIIRLHNLTKLNDAGIRLRFLVAKQIEKAISGLFPSASALPFGSSVNGFGKMGCDLDLVLRLNDHAKRIQDDTRLVYHCKASTASERSTSQKHMEAVGDIIQLFLPGCSQVRRILQARVPIIKFYQQFTDVECDLSMSNLSGVHMSDFLYLMGSMDNRVRPLVFAVRKWAAEVGLTNSSPGRWITNFSLTLLVLAFLQGNTLSAPILPSLNTLVKLSESKDKFITEEGINCTFLRDVNKYLATNPARNQENLQTLLKQFFEYYSQFDFATRAICLNEAVPITKPEHSALYIVNPLERGLNVSKNVSLEEMEKFRLEVRNAAWTLESQETKNTKWGLLSLFSSKNSPNHNNHNNALYNRHSKLIEVSKLFEEDEGFKNDSVKKQVQNIKKQTKEQIKKLELNCLEIDQNSSRR